MKARAVFDCMVFLQAAANEHGPAGACVERAGGEQVELCLSTAIRAEIVDLLARPAIRKKFRTLTAERVEKFLQQVDRVAIVVPDVPDVFTLKRDPKDSKYLNLAIAARAELIVSRDNDLIDLMTSDDDEPVAFRTAHPAIRILDPVSFLRLLPPEATDSSDEAP